MRLVDVVVVVVVEAKDVGPLSKRGSIYIQTRPRHTRDVPRLCGDQQTEKQHSHIAPIYNQAPRAAVCIFLPSRYRHTLKQHSITFF